MAEPTLTEHVCRAMLEELRRRRVTIDGSTDLVSVTLTVKLREGPEPVRAVQYEDERVRRGWRDGRSE